MGRPLRLKFSERNATESGNEKEEEGTSEAQPESSWISYAAGELDY